LICPLSSAAISRHGRLQVNPVLARRRAAPPENDIDLAAKRREKARQALDGRAAEPAAKDVGQVGLGN
jgi:hypothetical protein